MTAQGKEKQASACVGPRMQSQRSRALEKRDQPVGIQGDPTQGCLSRIRAKRVESQGNVSADSAVDFLLYAAAWGGDVEKEENGTPGSIPVFWSSSALLFSFKGTPYRDPMSLWAAAGHLKANQLAPNRGSMGRLGKSNSCENPDGITRLGQIVPPSDRLAFVDIL